MKCITPHWLKNVSVRVMSSPCSSMMSGSAFVLCFSVPRLVPFRVSLPPLALLFTLLPVLCPEPLLPCGQRQGNQPRRLRQLRSLAPWQNSPLSQVMSPSSLTLSTTRRLPKSSSGTNRATKNAVPSYLFGTELERRDHRQSALFTTVQSGARRTMRNENKHVTLMKKVCCQLSPFLCVTQERGDPCTNLVR